MHAYFLFMFHTRLTDTQQHFLAEKDRLVVLTITDDAVRYLDSDKSKPIIFPRIVFSTKGA